MRHSLILSALAATIALPCYSDAKDRPRQQFEIFWAPGGLEYLPPQNAPEIKAKPSYPLYPNRFTDYLPGNLYDVRKLFAAEGATFGPKDFAWFNPDRSVLVVGASRDDITFIKSFLSVLAYDPPENLQLVGDITVATKSVQPTSWIQWQIYGKSSSRIHSSAGSEANGLGYDLDIEPAMMADGTSVDCSLILKAMYGGTEYELFTQFTVPFGKRQTLLLGTTPKGERVEFHLTVKKFSLVPVSAYDNTKWKEGLLKRLREKSAIKSAPQSVPR